MSRTPHPSKERLDAVLVRQGFFVSREQAKRAVMAGQVYLDGERASKPGMPVPPDAPLTVNEPAVSFVSRGGLKLAKALQEFGIAVAGKTALDVGASTGGFTDCLLQQGAAHVYAVDVGYGQLAWSLRQDSRVSVLERTNARYLQPGQVPVVDIITVDVSFISLGIMLPALRPFLAASGDLVALVKPQFEAGPADVGKKGVVRSAQVHARVLANVLTQAAAAGFAGRGVTFSPVTGPEGNIEFLIHLTAAEAGAGLAWQDVVPAVVAAAHEELGKCGQ